MKSSKIPVALLVGTFGLSQWCAAAEPLPAVVEITVFGGYRYGGEFEAKPPDLTTTPDVDESTGKGRTLKLKDTPFVGLTLNVEQTEDAYYEFTYSRQSTDLTNTDNVFGLEVEYLHIGGMLQFPDGDNDHVIPYFALTLGGTRFTPKDSDLDAETDFSLGVGGGVRVPVTRHLGFRLEGRGYFTFVDSSSDIFCSSINGAGSCAIRVSGSSFFQAQVMLGATISF